MANAEKTLTLDKKMSTVFDWSASNIPVRDALWNHFMDTNEKNTLKTIDSMKKFEDMDDAQVAPEAQKLLQQ